MATGGMKKKVLVSVVDDDRFFRESMSSRLQPIFSRPRASPKQPA
jgi:hypothetical protein